MKRCITVIVLTMVACKDRQPEVMHDMHSMTTATTPQAPSIANLKDSLGPIQQHSQAMPDVRMAPNGDAYVAYVVTRKIAGKKWPESALRFARSADHGKTWSTPISITDTKGEFGAHNFHSMYVAANGIIFVSWLDGRLGQAAAYMAHSNDGGRTWSSNVQLDAEEACPCCRTAVIADSTGKLYVAWRKVFPGNVRDVVISTSSDTGKTWSKPVPVHNDNWVYNGCPHAGPTLGIEKDGQLRVTWWTGRPDEPGVYTALSSNGGQSFGEPMLLQKAKRPPGEHDHPGHPRHS